MSLYLDIATWNRREHFGFFKNMDLPYFGLVRSIECTAGRKYCRKAEIPFFIYYLHKCLVACNGIDNFKYRIEGEKVRVEPKINVSPTIGRDDGTFGFSFMEYDENFDIFLPGALKEIDHIRSNSGLCLRPDTGREDVIHFSAIPWVNFTHLSHAGSLNSGDSVPKISVGKITEEKGRECMPVSLHLHHALADGFHAGQFFNNLEELLNS